jgi:ribosomal protein L11 methyltransferase
MMDGCFDAVLANIHMNVLMTDGAAYLRILKNEGLLFVSGFYEQDLTILKQYFEGLGTTLKANTELDGWCAAVFQK